MNVTGVAPNCSIHAHHSPKLETTQDVYWVLMW